ncbi:MAG: RdgB/HAM1 family non-canonical purine NTP pyrophosphatase [Bacteroidota bacterium]|nr:RdgB/HAM1 family non-canonical purine NTP pyrophosphatase [Bacteroidota bacterium]
MNKRSLIFATHNAHKVKEARRLLLQEFELLSLSDVNFQLTLPERGDTIEKNAVSKAYFTFKRLQRDCFAEDTGLIVDSLDGKPGVHTARYAGEQATAEENIDLLLKNMEGKAGRKARFHTAIVLYYDGLQWLFEGTAEGAIATSRKGTGGFGYDSVFIPEGHERTFAEMTEAEKNGLSHRAKAMAKMTDFLVNRNPALPIIFEDGNRLL